MLFDPGSWSRRKYVFKDLEEWSKWNKLTDAQKARALAEKKERGEYILKSEEK